ncbi:MAG TPA: GNAT family N-acetyltransferase [Pilimelia sp.]|nr:GNAT family N-acetyltransferase [Pilimelia sp.]
MTPLPTTLTAGDNPVALRPATADDVPALTALSRAPPRACEGWGGGVLLLAPYRRAFAAVDADPAQLLLAVTHDTDVVGTAQLTEIPGLSRGGTTRLQVEAVRVRADLRGRGIGAAVFTWAVEEARRRGCGLVQLTTDTRRPEAHRFYERLGFTASHVGFKRQL